MDIVLKGGIDGVETTRRLRARTQVPVIYLTGHYDSGLVQRVKETEPLGFLLKPYEEPELHAVVEMAMQRHRLERRVRATEQWLHGTLSALQDAVIATDVLQRIGFMNPIAERLTGWKNAEAAECDLERVLHILSGEVASAVGVTERRTMETGAPAALPMNSTLFNRNGTQTPVEGGCSPIVNEDGFYTGFVWVLRPNVNRPNWANAENRDSDEPLANETAREVGKCLGDILRGATSVLGRLPESDANRASLLNIRDAAQRTLNLVKPTHDSQPVGQPRLGRIDVHAIVSKVCATLPQLISSAIALEYRPGRDVWPIYSSVERLEEIVINLCLNATETMPRGGKLLVETDNVTVTEDDALFQIQARAGDYVRLRVCDNGQGLPATSRARFFAGRPEQAATTPTRFGAVGEIVRDGRGWIECFSEPGTGTRIDVYLPRL
jgi:nitrogen-specific signal transduction histidine kinase